MLFLILIHTHRRQLQGQQQNWSREDVKTDGAVPNTYTALTLHPNSDLPPSPTNSPISSSFSSDIDPKWEFSRENITLCDVLCEGQFTILYSGVAKGIKDKPMDVAVKSVKGEYMNAMLYIIAYCSMTRYLTLYIPTSKTSPCGVRLEFCAIIVDVHSP